MEYKQSALHWNKNLFESRFTGIFETALKSYAHISKKTGVQINPQEKLSAYLAEVKRDFSSFMSLSRAGSQRSSASESQTRHRLEHLAEGDKAMFHLENYLGGVYYLTADEAFREGSTFVIQESKNSTKGALPSLADIRDGLFKLILFANIHRLTLGGKEVEFKVRLKLTSQKIIGSIRLPSSGKAFEKFIERNKKSFTARHVKIILALSNEVSENPRITIEIASNK